MEEARPSPRVLALSLLGLALFLAWQALSLGAYLRVESRPPAWDQAIHLDIALDYSQAITQGRWSDVMHLAPKSGMPPFPPFYHLLLRHAYSTSNPANAALWLNWFYLAVLCVSLFALAWQFRPDETALLCVVLFAGSPAVQDMMHTQLIDLAMTAWTAAAYWALLNSDEFKKWGGSLAFGVLFAVGMLHKWSFFSYLLPAAYMAVKAMGRPASRLQVMACGALTLALLGPWYWVHWPMLIPRLFQASADFAVPFWRSEALLTYPGEMLDGLGPLVMILSLIGICVPQFRRDWQRGWLLVAWFVTSYVFWTIVPNRQMRFLLPGLPALVAAGMGAWPRAVIWGLAAIQLFSLANFTAGWILPLRVPMPLRAMSFFPSQPPVREDWRIADILLEAQKRSDPSRPVANLTLVANDTRFNGPNFTWMAKLLELSRVRIRGVNSRLCEFAQFVVLKDGRLGPEGVIGGLPEAAQAITDPSGWFARAYAEVGRWPLPDGSSAVLYQQKRPVLAPFKGRKFQYQAYAAGPFEAADLRIDLGDWNSEQGVYRSARVSAGEVTLRGLRMTGVQIELEGLRLVPMYETGSDNWIDVRFLGLEKLRLRSLQVDADALRAFLEARLRGLSLSTVELDRTLKLRGQWRRLSVSAELGARILKAPAGLSLELLGVRLGATPLPISWVGSMRRYMHPFEPFPETPFVIEAPGLTLADGRLSIP
ncbi:MAG TPA: hypothetical protein DEB40_10280 [Elusimicrobia bacterium]|nr:hypothetical protein [Elusimicrobiota bacterium]HBT62116.1 hypothetical protein [Elusimicrobiota bacterium]